MLEGVTLLPAATAVCRHCPAQLHRVPVPSLDEWGWADNSGERFGTDADLIALQPDPYAYLAGIAAQLEAAQKVSDKRASRTWLYWAKAREYGALKVRLDFGTFHQHYPKPGSEVERGPRPDLVEHCDYPAWLRPSGWQCRVCSARLGPDGRELPADPGARCDDCGHERGQECGCTCC